MWKTEIMLSWGPVISLTTDDPLAITLKDTSTVFPSEVFPSQLPARFFSWSKDCCALVAANRDVVNTTRVVSNTRIDFILGFSPSPLGAESFVHFVSITSSYPFQ